MSHSTSGAPWVIHALVDWQIGRLAELMTDNVYSLEPRLRVGEFIDVLRRSILAERRPIERFSDDGQSANLPMVMQ